jgi:hypothetical protein
VSDESIDRDDEDELDEEEGEELPENVRPPD